MWVDLVPGQVILGQIGKIAKLEPVSQLVLQVPVLSFGPDFSQWCIFIWKRKPKKSFLP